MQLLSAAASAADDPAAAASAAADPAAADPAAAAAAAADAGVYMRWGFCRASERQAAKNKH